MVKKTRKKKSVRTRVPSEVKTVRRKPGDQEIRQDENDKSGPFDFGGLPVRDLKKNLGCG